MIEGVILALQSQCSPHSRAQTLLLKALSIACDKIDNCVQPWVELSVAVSADSEPQPDVVVAYGLPDSGAIAPDAVALIIEISDTTSGLIWVRRPVSMPLQALPNIGSRT